MSTEDTEGYTVVTYWPGRSRYNRLDKNEYDSAEEATNASINAQVEGAEEVWIFRGEEVSEQIADWKETSDRVEAGKKKKAAEERALEQRKAAESARVQGEYVEKFEREQLRKLKEKYPNA